MPSDKETTATATVVETTPASNSDVASVEEGHKVFVGNLSFQTTEEGLTSFFETSGKVLDAKIITIRRRFPKRFPRRSAGYGFVTFATLEEATKATEQLNKKELDGREINVEVARPKPIVENQSGDENATSNESTEKKERPVRPRNFRNNNTRGRFRRYNNRRPSRNNESSEDANEQSNESSNEKRRNVQNKKNKEAAAPTSASDEDNESVASDTPITRRPRRNFRGKKRFFKKRGSRFQRRPRKVELTIPSETTLFVANLPYASTDETLKEVFSSYKVVSATVNRMRNGRSKGYGFVEFETQEEQQKALSNVKDVELDGRTIYLSVALSAETPKEESKADGESKDETKDEPKKEVKEEAKDNKTKENGVAK
ncbi:unnamed protein product [Cunninghamella blakesleeana]